MGTRLCTGRRGGCDSSGSSSCGCERFVHTEEIVRVVVVGMFVVVMVVFLTVAAGEAAGEALTDMREMGDRWR